MSSVPSLLRHRLLMFYFARVKANAQDKPMNRTNDKIYKDRTAAIDDV